MDRRRAGGRPTPASAYASRVRDEAIAELARAARLKAGFFRPAFTGLMMRALRESAAIRSVMADLVAGRQSYASLKWRLLKTFELGLAWRALRTTTANDYDTTRRLTTNVSVARADAQVGPRHGDVDRMPRRLAGALPRRRVSQQVLKSQLARDRRHRAS